MHYNTIIFLFIFSLSTLLSSPLAVSEGFYVGESIKDSITVKTASDKIELEFRSGTKHVFKLDEKVFKEHNLSKDGHIILKTVNKSKFTLLYDHQLGSKSKIDTFNLYKEPGLLNKIIGALVASALLFSIFQFYLKLNKVWKRRKILEVANSISIVASLLGFVTLVPFLLNSILISQDYPSSLKYVLGLFLATIMSLISMGYFVEENRNKGIFRLLTDALWAEKSESTDLLNAMLRPKGAKKIIDILTSLAAIDDDVAQKEIDLIVEFSDRWGIQIPELKAGKPGKVTNLIELKELVQSYLDEMPDIEVASNLVDLINMMAEADDEVTKEEEMAISEFTGMINNYISKETGQAVDMYEVVIVPQSDKQTDSVKTLLPNIESVKERGGTVFKVGVFYSEDYASAICAKYIDIGLFTSYIKSQKEH